MATCCNEKANSTLLIWTEHLKYGLCYLHIPTLSFFKHFSFTSFTFCFSWLSTVKGVIVEPKQQVNFIQPHFIWGQVVSLPFGRGKGRLTTWSHTNYGLILSAWDISLVIPFAVATEPLSTCLIQNVCGSQQFPLKLKLSLDYWP